LVCHGRLQFARAPVYTLAVNLGLEIVAIHPDSGA
jgi:hypothetical protein